MNVKDFLAQMKTPTKDKKQKLSWWSRQGPWAIGRLGIFTNKDSGKLLGFRYFTKGKGCAEFWREWGEIHFYVCIFRFWICFRYAYGEKTHVIPRWMRV